MGYIYRAFNTISRKSYVGLTTRTVEKRKGISNSGDIVYIPFVCVIILPYYDL